MAIDSAGYWQNHSIYNLGTSWYTMYCPYYSPFSEAPKFSSAVLVSCSFNLFFQLCPTLSTLQFYQVCSGGHKPNSENRVNLLGRLRSQVGSSKHRFSLHGTTVPGIPNKIQTCVDYAQWACPKKIKILQCLWNNIQSILHELSFMAFACFQTGFPRNFRLLNLLKNPGTIWLFNIAMENHHF